LCTGIIEIGNLINEYLRAKNVEAKSVARWRLYRCCLAVCNSHVFAAFEQIK